MVECPAGMGDSGSNQITDLDWRARWQPQVRVLVVQLDDLVSRPQWRDLAFWRRAIQRGWVCYVKWNVAATQAKEDQVRFWMGHNSRPGLERRLKGSETDVPR